MRSEPREPPDEGPCRWPVRVCCRDTDAADTVHYASCLCALHGASKEWLAVMDVTVAAPVSEHSAVFAVNRLETDYRLPARWYRASIVTLSAVERGGGHLAVAQEVHRARELMAGRRVSVASVNPPRGGRLALALQRFRQMEKHG